MNSTVNTVCRGFFIKGNMRTKRKTRRVFKPVSTARFFYNPPNLPPLLSGYENECRWFLHKIFATSFNLKDPEEWINISWQTLEECIHPTNVSKVKKFLIDSKIIECNGYYSVSTAHRRGHSMGYRVLPPYQRVKRIEVTNRVVAAKMTAKRFKHNGIPCAEEDLSYMEKELLKWLRLLRIDRDKAYQKISGASERKLREKGWKDTLKALYEDTQRLTIDELYESDFGVATCEYGRFHSPLTRLNGDCKEFLYMAGYEPLVSIDIRNSQIIFLCLGIIAKHTDAIIDIDNKCNDISSCSFLSPNHPTTAIALTATMATSSTLHSPIPPISIRPSSQIQEENLLNHLSLIGLSTDTVQFIGAAIAGQTYDLLQQDYNAFTGSNLTRNEVKEKIIKNCLFGNTNQGNWVAETPEGQVFRNRYPSVWEYIVEQKRWHGAGDRSEAFKQLPRAMQKSESQFMYGQVVKHIMEKYPEIPILTVHDSIITPANFVERVKSVFYHEFRKWNNIRPTLHCE